MLHHEELTEKLIAAAIEVHRHLGPGLLESVYEECYIYELGIQGVVLERQKPLPLVYKEIKLDCGYRMDVVADNKAASINKGSNILADMIYCSHE